MSLTIRTDVTAVKLCKNFVLAGIGSLVHVFDKESAKLLQRFPALNGQKIYGFVTGKSENKILVFGGKQYSLVSLNFSLDDESVVFTRLFEPMVCDDWIHSGIWCDDSTIALLTAHNVVQKWDTLSQTLQLQYISKLNSILYSGLLVPLQDDLLVLAGTVFSEVIIHRCGREQPLHHLKGHRGVIFSISCDLEKGIILTTSDDRSLRIWNLTNTANCPHDTKQFWDSVDIVCLHEVYGHSARVMRSCITSDYIVSVGEDSAICFWDLKGNLLRKVMSHQNGCIWSVDSDNKHLVTGGGDCGVILHPLTIANDYGEHKILELDVGVPKKVLFTARRKVIVINETNELIYHDLETKSKMVNKLNHESTYKLLSITPCKQIIAVTDMNGQLDVFADNCKDAAYVHNIISTKLQIGKILSMQWAGNRHLVFCSDDGTITVLASKGNITEVLSKFALPPCKERWLTASAIEITNGTFVFGDRCGNVHIYVNGQRDPIKSFTKVHGRYGPTSVTIKNSEIITTGRDGTIRYFSIDNDSNVQYLNSKELEFQWVEKFIDRDERIICGFQERVFVVYDIQSNAKLLEVSCGGGHRSWDAIRYFDKINDGYDEFISVVYLKNSEIHTSTFQMSKIVSRNLVNGSHSKEINCLKTYKTDFNKTLTYYISGGEDTTLRISSMDSEMRFQDEFIFKQLSSIRALRSIPIRNNEILLISAGGRAQICVKTVKFDKINDEIKITSQDLIDYLIKGTDKERKGNTSWRNCSVDFDPETRIMDLDVISDEDDFILFAGCSDACVRIFQFTENSHKLELITQLNHHKTCILKTNCIKYKQKDVLVTCSTRGEVTFWDVTNIKKTDKNIEPAFTVRTNMCGINSFASRLLSDSRIVTATGGDDNCLHLYVLDIPDQYNLESMRVSHTWSSDKLHCSQITGLLFLDDVLVSTSIDQRITVCKWSVSEKGIACELLSQTFCNVADIQGMDLLEYSSDAVTVCPFGKGLEVVKLSRS